MNRASEWVAMAVLASVLTALFALSVRALYLLAMFLSLAVVSV